MVTLVEPNLGGKCLDPWHSCQPSRTDLRRAEPVARTALRALADLGQYRASSRDG